MLEHTAPHLTTRKPKQREELQKSQLYHTHKQRHQIPFVNNYSRIPRWFYNHLQLPADHLTTTSDTLVQDAGSQSIAHAEHFSSDHRSDNLDMPIARNMTVSYVAWQFTRTSSLSSEVILNIHELALQNGPADQFYEYE